MGKDLHLEFLHQRLAKHRLCAGHQREVQDLKPSTSVHGNDRRGAWTSSRPCRNASGQRSFDYNLFLPFVPTYSLGKT